MTHLVHATCFEKALQAVQLNGLIATTFQRPMVFTPRVAASLTCLILMMTVLGHVLMMVVNSLNFRTALHS